MADTPVRSHAPTDADRMEWAVELATATPPGEVCQQRRIGWAMLAVFGAVAVIALADDVFRSAGRSTVPGWRTDVGWALTVTGWACVVLLFRRTLRDGWVVRPPSRPLEALSPPQRRRIRRQVLGRETAVVAESAVTRHVARDLTSPTRWPWIAVGAVGVAAGNAVRHDPPGWWILLAALGVVVAVRAVVSAHQARRARAFLVAHPGAAGPTDG